MSYKFMQNCILKGISSFEDICNEAKKEIETIQYKISEIDKEKNKLSLYLKDLKNIIKSSDLNQKNYSIIMVTTTWEELSDDIKLLCKNIIKKMIPVSSIHANEITSSSIDENIRKNNISAIKWLIDQKIILRVGQNVLKGTNWDNRCDELKEIEND